MLRQGNIRHDLAFFGRTLYEEKTDTVFFNWTGSGFEVAFEATKLEVVLLTLESANPFEGTLCPIVSVFLDAEESPVQEIYLNQPETRLTLHESSLPERHRIRVVKRTENDKGKVGVSDIAIDGAFLPLETDQTRLRLEFIGDSISCGFGNEASKREGLFVPMEENGCKTYCAVAAKLLDAEYHNISVSGISLCAPLDPDFQLVIPEFDGLRVRVKAMEDFYDYTDRVYEETCGKVGGFTPWDFSRYQPDAIIINLGTNDSYRIKAAGNSLAEVAHFERRYEDFIRRIRERNGSKPIIGCTLGPMDYYLYDNIVEAVRSYKNATGDERVFCYKFGGIYPMQEGFGTGDHPSLITHARMGRELSELLKCWI